MRRMKEPRKSITRLDRPDSRPLTDVRICLIFEHSLSHYTRILQEIQALRDAGALVQWLTSHPATGDAPPEMLTTLAPLEVFSALSNSVAQSQVRWRPLRIADNLLRNTVRRVLRVLDLRSRARVRIRALQRLASEVDLFWVIDYPSLPTALRVAKQTGVRVLYETVDLVPEYHYRGDRYRKNQLRAERRLIGQVDAFITACDSYADYYMERYGSILARRPVVRDNMPPNIVDSIRPSSRPLRILFLGSLMFDRPVAELIDALALVRSDVTLTFQGKNLVGDMPHDKIRALGLAERIYLLDPCPPESIVETAAEYDVGIVALKGENENERRASTSKLFTYMSAGLAILGSNLPGIARVIRAYNNGLLVDTMEPAMWAAAIDEIASLSASDIDALKQRSLDGAREHSWEEQRARFVAEFVRGLSGGEAP